MAHPAHPQHRAEPRWPALLALLAVGALFAALPEPLTLGPSWLPLVVVAALALPLTFTHRAGHVLWNRYIGLGLCALITVALVCSLAALIAALPSHSQPAASLMRSGLALWLSNILVFASWYWRLDGGGPHARDRRHMHEKGAFLFPQMTMPDPDLGWKPGFVDYLFLAFNTSTAFSPTDVPVLSPWAKLLMMAQSLLSLGIVVILVARAVNIF